MKRSKFSEEQIAYALRQAESGTPAADICRQLGISEASCAACARSRTRIVGSSSWWPISPSTRRC